jgi:hypothetical protein
LGKFCTKHVGSQPTAVLRAREKELLEKGTGLGLGGAKELTRIRIVLARRPE